MSTTRRPSARQEQLLIERLESGEVVAYDLRTDRAHSLNLSAATVWQLCDGQNTVEDLCRQVAELLPDLDASATVRLALDELQGADLLTDEPLVTENVGIDRRQLLHRIGVGTVAAAAAPVVLSILAPTSAAASTCLPSGACTTTALDCCSKLTRNEPSCTAISGFPLACI